MTDADDTVVAAVVVYAYLWVVMVGWAGAAVRLSWTPEHSCLAIGFGLVFAHQVIVGASGYCWRQAGLAPYEQTEIDETGYIVDIGPGADDGG